MFFNQNFTQLLICHFAYLLICLFAVIFFFWTRRSSSLAIGGLIFSKDVLGASPEPFAKHILLKRTFIFSSCQQAITSVYFMAQEKTGHWPHGLISH